MSSAGANGPAGKGERDEEKSGDQVKWIVRQEEVDDGEEEEQHEEDNSHDDYIREFSFEPEIIVPKRTPSANSLTSSSTCASLAKDRNKDPTNRSQRSHSGSNHKEPRVRFLRPNSLSLSLYKLRPPGPAPLVKNTATTESSIIPTTAAAAAAAPPPTLSSSSVDTARPSTSTSDHHGCISLAEVKPSEQEQQRRKFDSNKSARPFVVNAEGRHAKDVGDNAEINSAKSAAGNFSDDDNLQVVQVATEEETNRGKKCRRRRFWWCFGKDRPSSSDQVHHEIEAFYYVGGWSRTIIVVVVVGMLLYLGSECGFLLVPFLPLESRTTREVYKVLEEGVYFCEWFNTDRVPFNTHLHVLNIIALLN